VRDGRGETTRRGGGRDARGDGGDDGEGDQDAVSRGLVGRGRERWDVRGGGVRGAVARGAV
jgi:hypothetical protein